MSNFFEFKEAAMGGFFQYRSYPQANLSKEDILVLFQEAHREVIRIEKKYTEFFPSEITKINDNAGIQDVEIGDELLFLLKKSKEFYRKSHGLFDPTYASYLYPWRRKEKLGPLEKYKLRSLVDFNKVNMDEKNKKIFLPYKGQRIGLGGIGKGYAVDRAFEFLKKAGLYNFSVNGSGDIRVSSHENAPRPWRVGIRNPFSSDREKSAGFVQIENGSISTSGSYIQNKKGSAKDHHIVSKYEGENIPISCTIVGESCMETDVWATISMAQSIQDSVKLLNEEDIFAVLIDVNGSSILSKKALERFGF